jgi:hypothetical protein
MTDRLRLAAQEVLRVWEISGLIRPEMEALRRALAEHAEDAPLTGSEYDRAEQFRSRLTREDEDEISAACEDNYQRGFRAGVEAAAVAVGCHPTDSWFGPATRDELGRAIRALEKVSK